MVGHGLEIRPALATVLHRDLDDRPLGNGLDRFDRRELDLDGVLERGEVGLEGIEVHAERAVTGRHVTDPARRPGADSRRQQDRPFVDHRIDRRLELDEQHRIAAMPDPHARNASSNFR